MVTPLKISIVTVVYNDYKNIEDTINSVLSQEYNNIEYIVIDGGSTDGTVDIIKRYADRLSYWISEPDKGIYDAMNKGIEHCTGQWINFMNCGDTFNSNDVISKIFSNQENLLADVLYGDVLLQYNNIGAIIRRYNNLKPDTVSTNLCHQSTFIRTELMRKYKYDTSFKIAADVYFFYQIHEKEDAQFKYVPIVVANYESEDGVSAKNLRRMYQEYQKIHNIKKFSYAWLKMLIKNELKLLFYNMPFGLSDILKERRLKRLYNNK